MSTRKSRLEAQPAITASSSLPDRVTTSWLAFISAGTQWASGHSRSDNASTRCERCPRVGAAGPVHGYRSAGNTSTGLWTQHTGRANRAGLARGRGMLTCTLFAARAESGCGSPPHGPPGAPDHAAEGLKTSACERRSAGGTLGILIPHDPVHRIRWSRGTVVKLYAAAMIDRVCCRALPRSTYRRRERSVVGPTLGCESESALRTVLRPARHVPAAELIPSRCWARSSSGREATRQPRSKRAAYFLSPRLPLASLDTCAIRSLTDRASAMTASCSSARANFASSMPFLGGQRCGRGLMLGIDLSP